MKFQDYLAQEHLHFNLRNCYLLAAMTCAQVAHHEEMMDFISLARKEYQVSDEAVKDLFGLCNRVHVEEEKERGIHEHDEDCGCGDKAQANPRVYEAPSAHDIEWQAEEVRKMADRSKAFAPDEKAHIYNAVALALDGNKDSMIAQIAMVDRGLDKNLILDLVVGLYNRVMTKKMMASGTDTSGQSFEDNIEAQCESIRGLIDKAQSLTEDQRDDLFEALNKAQHGKVPEMLDFLSQVRPKSDIEVASIKDDIREVCRRVVDHGTGAEAQDGGPASEVHKIAGQIQREINEVWAKSSKKDQLTDALSHATALESDAMQRTLNLMVYHDWDRARLDDVKKRIIALHNRIQQDKLQAQDDTWDGVDPSDYGPQEDQFHDINNYFDTPAMQAKRIEPRMRAILEGLNDLARNESQSDIMRSMFEAVANNNMAQLQVAWARMVNAGGQRAVGDTAQVYANALVQIFLDLNLGYDNYGNDMVRALVLNGKSVNYYA